MSFFRKMQKELEQKSNSESQNNQPIIEFLQSTATSVISRVDMSVISDFVSSEKSVNRSPQYRKWTVKQRYTIGKYAAENGNANTLRKFKTEFTNLSESTVRTFKKRYYKEVRKCKKKLEKYNKVCTKNRKTLPSKRARRNDSKANTFFEQNRKCNQHYCCKRNHQGSNR